MSAATKLTNQVIDFVYRKKGYAWRASSTGVFDQKAGAYRTAAKKGVADILCCIPPAGQLVAIEIKIGKDRLSDEQIGFLKNIKNVGGRAFVVFDFEQFKNEWEKLSTGEA